MSKVFLSYRREDSRLMCDRIYDSLQSKFGHDSVFRDIDNIPPGVVFTAHVAKVFAGCKVVLVLMGPEWLSETGRRLEHPRDYVRMEIENALEFGIPIIPTLLLNAEMPTPEQLPQSIRNFAVFNAIRVRPDPDFRNDIDNLTKAVARYVPLVVNRTIPRRLLLGTAAGIAVIALGGLATVKGGSIFGQYPDVSGTWNGTLTTTTNNGPSGDIQLIIRQQQTRLHGMMAFQLPLSPDNDGSVDGTVGTDGTIKFAVENNLHTQTLQFDGVYSPAENTLSGTYTSTHGFSGNWRVVRTSDA